MTNQQTNNHKHKDEDWMTVSWVHRGPTYGQRAVIYGDAAVSVLLTPVAIWYSLRARVGG